MKEPSIPAGWGKGITTGSGKHIHICPSGRLWEAEVPSERTVKLWMRKLAPVTCAGACEGRVGLGPVHRPDLAGERGCEAGDRGCVAFLVVPCSEPPSSSHCVHLKTCFYNGASENWKVCDTTCRINKLPCTPTW
jgi:hypothetical protein